VETDVNMNMNMLVPDIQYLHALSDTMLQNMQEKDAITALHA
jgi:hypothetical protein